MWVMRGMGEGRESRYEYGEEEDYDYIRQGLSADQHYWPWRAAGCR